MKSILSTALCLIASLTLASAQFSIGAKTGIDATNFTLDQSKTSDYSLVEDQSSLATVGVVAEYQLSTLLSLRSELNYSQSQFSVLAFQSSTFLGVSTIPGVQTDFRLNQWTLPLTARISLGNGPVKFIGEGGAYGSFISGINADIRGRFNNDLPAPSSEVDMNNEDLNQLQYGYLLGGGMEYSLGASRVQFNVRYQQALNDVLNGSSFGLQQDIISATVTYLHRL